MNVVSFGAVAAGAIGLMLGIVMGFGAIPGLSTGLPATAKPVPTLTINPVAWHSAGTSFDFWVNGTSKYVSSMTGTITVGTQSTTGTASYSYGGGTVSYSAVLPLVPGTYSVTGSLQGQIVGPGGVLSPYAKSTSPVTLVVTAGGGSTPSILVASFTYAQSPGSLVVAFVDSSTGQNGVTSSAATNTWTFGDGASATGGRVSHTYAMAGLYSVTEVAHGTTATGQTISNTSTQSAAVWPSNCFGCVTTITPFFTYTTGGLNTSFVDASVVGNGTALYHNWSFGDGTNGTGVSVTHTYLRAGTYMVTETVVAGAVLGGEVTQRMSTNLSVSASSTNPPPPKTCVPTCPTTGFVLGPVNGGVMGFSVGLIIVGVGLRSPKGIAIALGLGAGAGLLGGFLF